jgi:hypothetical protein
MARAGSSDGPRAPSAPRRKAKTMLKVREIRDEGASRTVYRLTDDDRKPAAATLDKLVAVATRLLIENGLAGAFRLSGEEEVTLDLASSPHHFMHDGILFAALDAVNDPVRNPTLNLPSGNEPPVE